MSEATCQWRQTEDEHTPDTWQADCGAMWTFTDGGPKDNNMNFCPKCGKTLSQIDNAMINKTAPYASEAETQALLIPEARMAAERKLAHMMIERGADEQGAEAYPILWKIAVELLAEQPAPVQQEPEMVAAFRSSHAYTVGFQDGKAQTLAEQPAQQDIEELTAQRDKLADILTHTANALKGEPAELTLHSWHDLPEVAQQLKPAQQEPVAFYVYKPTLPRGHLGTVSDGDLPWVYDQDPSSGFSARMLVAPVTSPPARHQEPVAQCMDHGECFGGKCIYPAQQPPQQQEPIGYEKYAAIREGHRNACEEAYFGARPDLPLSTSTLTAFRHGFDRGYDVEGKQHRNEWLIQLQDEIKRLQSAQQPAQRKPLTVENITEIYKLSFPEYDIRTATEDAIRYARAIEAAHGIKEQQ